MIELWMIYIIIACIALMLEIFMPTLFCINFAIGGIITAIISIFWGNFYSLTLIFLAISLLSLFFLKPVLAKLIKKDEKADFDSQYIGKIVKSIENINTVSGAVTIYDERWEARVKEGNEEIPADTDVRIIEKNSTILFVEKV